MTSGGSSRSPEGDGRDRPAYATTRWSLLLARDGDTRKCWEHFYERYRPAVAALYARKGVPAGEVDDMVHDFFAHAFTGELLQAADPVRGRFRGYLRVAAERFLVSSWRKAGRQKRRPEGGVAALGTDVVDHREPSPADAYDVAWARSVLEAAHEQVRSSLAARGKDDHLRAFEARNYEGAGWDEIGQRFGTSPEAARKWVSRVQERLSSAVRAEVQDTVTSPEELEAELSELAGLLAGRGA